MKKNRPQRHQSALCAIPGLLAVAFVLLGGCMADRPPTAPEQTWEEVRYHRSETSAGDGFRDVTVDASGGMLLDLQGQRAPTRGLLAGENLETLTRLIDALPPAGYRGSNGQGSFFLSLRIGNERRDYVTGPEDAEAPTALVAIAEQFDRWIEETRENRRVVVPFRVLAEGPACAVRGESYRIVRSRDELLALLSRLGPEGPSVIPSVDFNRETLIGLFLGDRRGVGYGVSVDVTYRTFTGQLVIAESRTEPDGDCAGIGGDSAPFLLIAVKTPAVGDLLIESTTTLVSCP